MDTTTRLLLPEVTDVLTKRPYDLAPLAEELHPADLADLAAALPLDLATQLLKVLPVDKATALVEQASLDLQVRLFETIAETSLPLVTAITDAMAADDRADLFAELPHDLQTKLLETIDAEESADIRQLLAHPEDSAGALMTTEFVAVHAGITAAQAIDIVRHNAEQMETVYQAYAVDPNDTLLGVISLRDLVTAKASRPIDELMNPKVVSIPAEADQEQAARIMGKYDLLALPVVNSHHQIIGIITVDDVMDVVEEEATEDVQKLGAVDPLEVPYLAVSVWGLIRARAPWLIALFVAVLATENVLEYYSSTHSQSQTGVPKLIDMLMWFVPLIISSGGNSGSQSATLIIRAMALGRLQGESMWRLLRRELIVGIVLGLLLSTVGILRLLLTQSTRSLALAATVSLSIFMVVVVGALVGTGVPMVLRRLGIDPAVSSTPFIASILDVFGLIIYFEIARRIILAS